MTQPPTPPIVPNFNPGVGRLVTDRYDFETHVNGTTYINVNGNLIDFRHQANQIDVVPSIIVAGDGYSNVQTVLQAIADNIIIPSVPNATATVLGLIKLSGDLAGISSSAISPKVGGLQGRPIANASPSSGQSLIWNGSSWIPGTPIITLGGDVAGNASSNTVNSISGPSPISVNSSLNIKNGTTLTLQSGSTQNVAGGANFSILSGASFNIISGGSLTASGAAAIQINTAGGLVLEAANDFVQFGTNHSRTICNHFIVLSGMGTGDGYSWAPATTVNGFGLTANSAGNPLIFKIDNLHNGATLHQLKIAFQTGDNHTGIPDTLPYVAIVSVPFTYNILSGVYLLSTTTAPYPTGYAVYPTPGSVSAYDMGGAGQTFSYTTDQNNVIDTANNMYFGILYNESGTNSNNSNIYFGYSVEYTNITSDQFP